MRGPWTPRLALAAWSVGLLAAGYLTLEHFTHNATLACSDSGLVNCASVTTSAYSTLLGVPVALLGLVYFAATLAAWLLVGRRLPPVTRARAVAVVSGVGVLFVLWLVWAELVGVGRICLWCTVVHVVVVSVFVGSLVRLGSVRRRPAKPAI